MSTAEELGAAAADQRVVRKEYVKPNAGLTTVPTKVIIDSDLELLDLSHNEIEVVPKGVFPEIVLLKTLQLSHNRIKALADDVGCLKQLQVLDLQGNRLAALPESLCTLTALRELDASHNLLSCLPTSIGRMEGLQVMNIAANRLRAVSCEVGWLGLKQLNISDNPELHIPAHVLQCGFKAVMSYLQVVGEQHALVARHLGGFTSRLADLQAKHGIVLGPLEDEAAVALRLKVAQRLGILSCSHCQLISLPAAFDESAEALGKVQVADFSHNQLKRLPAAALAAMKLLVVLNLSYNKLKSLDLPAELLLESVRVLDLSFNRLASLPAGLGQQLPALQQLYLSNNFLADLPDSLGSAPLQDLFLSENAFEAVPKVLARCTGLAKLSLAACRLTAIGEDLAGLTSLRFLDVSFNQLASLPQSMSGLVVLAALNLSFNPLHTLPEVCCSLHSLRELNLDNTGIAAFPAGLGQLRLLEGLQAENCPLVQPFAALYARDPLLLVRVHDPLTQALDLSEIGLEAVPPMLLQLTALTELNLSRNSIKELPQELGQLQALAQVLLKGNPLRQPFLKLLDAKGEQALLAFLRPDGSQGDLDIEGCGFESLPRDVWESPGRARLVALQLTNNRLRDLPQELSTLVSLTRLVLDNNLLRQLPAVVLALPCLAVLMASSNSLTYLPEALGSAQQLQALILHSNQLMQLPDSLTQLTNLRALAATSNRLWSLPAGIAACSGLRLLDCSHNLMSRLPAGLGRLSRLRSLKLTHNKLAHVPADELRLLPGLAELHLAANNFTVPVAMNASDELAVQQLLEAVAASPVGQPLPAAGALSRHPSSLFSSVNSASPSIADSTRAFLPARSRLESTSNPGTGPMLPPARPEGQGAAATASAGPGSPEPGSPAAATGHGRSSGVRWSDEAGDAGTEECSTGSALAGSGSLRSSWNGAATAAVASCMRHSSDSAARHSLDSGGGCVRHAVHFSQEVAAAGGEAAGEDPAVAAASLAAAASKAGATVAASSRVADVGTAAQGAADQPHPGDGPAAADTATQQLAVSAGVAPALGPVPPAAVAPARPEGVVSPRPPATAPVLAPGQLLPPPFPPAGSSGAAGVGVKQAAAPAQVIKRSGSGSGAQPAGLLQSVEPWPGGSNPVSAGLQLPIPSIVRALLAEAPPPPERAAGGEAAGGRPQARARFKRVMQQTAMAMALLEKTMQQQQQQQQQQQHDAAFD